MSKNKTEEFSYETARKRLEKIQADLEAGKIQIDDLEKVLNEARELIKKCLIRLGDAEKNLDSWEI